MRTFETPEPITVDVDLGVGDLRIVAGDRTDTTVEVLPSNSTKKGDITAAEQTRIEFADGVLLIRAPKGWKQRTFWGGGESIDVRIALPAGSGVRGGASVAALRCTGRIGECRFTSGVGDLRLDEAGPVSARTGAGDIDVGSVTGDVELKTGSGTVRIERIAGAASIKNSNGNTWIGEATGDVRARAANGDIVVDRAGAAVAVKTANGNVRIGEVARGEVVAETAFGKVDIGVLDGVPVWLDLETKFGRVRNDLMPAERPKAGEAAVEVRAHTSYGDIAIRRARDAREEEA